MFLPGQNKQTKTPMPTAADAQPQKGVLKHRKLVNTLGANRESTDQTTMVRVESHRDQANSPSPNGSVIRRLETGGLEADDEIRFSNAKLAKMIARG